jgi:hypothetical protein
VADKRWTGAAGKVKQVQTFAFGGTWEADDLIRVSFANGKKYDFVAGSTVTATVVSNLATAWAALDPIDYPEFAEITPSAGTTMLTLTAVTAGVPFTVTLTPLEANGAAADAQTIEGAGVATTGTAATASSGPEDLNVAANWSTNTLPVNSDTLYFDNSAGHVRWNLSALAALTGITVHRAASHTGEIGLPEVNATGGYPEYRATELTFTGGTFNQGAGQGNGAGRCRVNLQATNATVNVLSTGTATDPSLAAFTFRGTGAANVLNVAGGDVGVGLTNGEAATVATLKQSGGTVRLGKNVTLGGTVTKSGGDLLVQSGTGTTLTQEDGTLTVLDPAAFAALNNLGGSVDYRSTGTFGVYTGQGGTSVDFSGDPRTKTGTRLDLYSGASVNDPLNTLGNTPFKTPGCALVDVRIDIGSGKTYTPS